MGGLLIKNKELRCKDCFRLYSLRINPIFPTCKIIRACNCGNTEIEIQNFLSEYKKNKNLSISCSKCKKNNPKEPKYCHDCQKLYCINCYKNIHTENIDNKSHKLIPIEKYDFFCIQHPNNNFCAYCKTCKINVCIQCGKDKFHEGHKIIFYHKIYNEKKMKDYLKKAIESSKVKIDYNKKIYLMISKELKNKEINKTLKTLNEINEMENKKILEMINILEEIYDISKPKNYRIIMNMLDNIDFNLERIKFGKDSSKENDANSLINYYKNNFILKVKEKQKEVPTTLEEQFFNDKFNAEIENDKKEGEEVKIEGNMKEKKEEKKEENGENKEEKKEVNEKEEENKEEEKEDEKDNMHIKTIQEKKNIIEKKINEKGGFQQGDSISSSNKNNDIINSPKGNPNDVVNIISNQTINKKAKKKPKKINFES